MCTFDALNDARKTHIREEPQKGKAGGWLVIMRMNTGL
jgi:hypothetical protein